MGAVADVGQQHGELIAAHARHRVAIAQALANAPPGFNQQLVTLGMAQGIVDFLEVIQINEEHGHALLVSRACSHFGLQPVAQHTAIGQTRQRVKVSLMPNQRVSLLALADVSVGAQHAKGFAFGVTADHGAARENPLPAAILAAHAVLVDIVGRLAREMRLLVAHHLRLVFWVNQVGIVIAALPHFIFAVAVHLFVAG